MPNKSEGVNNSHIKQRVNIRLSQPVRQFITQKAGEKRMTESELTRELIHAGMEKTFRVRIKLGEITQPKSR